MYDTLVAVLVRQVGKCITQLVTSQKMGLKVKMSDVLQADESCASAFNVPLIALRSTVSIVDDVGWALRVIKKRDGSRVMTGDEYMSVWWASHLRQITALQARVHIITVDDATRVPAQKMAELEKRSTGEDKKGAKPYPLNAVVVAGGVLQPDKGTVRPMDMDRICACRHMRKSLFDFVCTSLRSVEIPAGVAVILDYDASGPHLYQEPSKGYRHLTHVRHLWGEADLMIPFWCRVFRDFGDIVVNSMDSDLFVVMLNYLESVRGEESKYGLSWQRHTGGPIDMRRLATSVGNRVYPLTVMAILLGSDFHAKGSCIGRSNSENLLKWALSSGCTMESYEGWDLTELIRGAKNTLRKPLAHPHLLPNASPSTAAAAAALTPEPERAAAPAAAAAPAPSGAAAGGGGGETKTTAAAAPRAGSVKRDVFGVPTTMKKGAARLLKQFIRNGLLAVNTAKGKAWAPADDCTPEGMQTWAWNMQYWTTRWTGVKISHTSIFQDK